MYNVGMEIAFGMFVFIALACAILFMPARLWPGSRYARWLEARLQALFGGDRGL